MTFDSHVLNLVDVAARLVNAVTPGLDGGHDVTMPGGQERQRAVADALGGGERRTPAVTARQATSLAAHAVQMRKVFEATDRGDLTEAARVLNVHARSAPAPGRSSTHSPQGGWHVHFHGTTDGLATGWAAGCATGLALAIGSDLAGRLGVCEAERCDRVYVDTSKNAGRRFCSTSLPEPHEGGGVPTAAGQRSLSAAGATREPRPSSPSVRAIARPMPTDAASSTSSSRSGPSVKQCTVRDVGCAGQQHPAVVAYAADRAGLVGEGRVVDQRAGQRVAVPLLLQHRARDGVPRLGHQAIDARGVLPGHDHAEPGARRQRRRGVPGVRARVGVPARHPPAHPGRAPGGGQRVVDDLESTEGVDHGVGRGVVGERGHQLGHGVQRQRHRQAARSPGRRHRPPRARESPTPRMSQASEPAATASDACSSRKVLIVDAPL